MQIVTDPYTGETLTFAAEDGDLFATGLLEFFETSEHARWSARCARYDQLRHVARITEERASLATEPGGAEYLHSLEEQDGVPLAGLVTRMLGSDPTEEDEAALVRLRTEYRAARAAEMGTIIDRMTPAWIESPKRLVVRRIVDAHGPGIEAYLDGRYIVPTLGQLKVPVEADGRIWTHEIGGALLTLEEHGAVHAAIEDLPR